MTALRTTFVRIGQILLVYLIAWHVAFIILLVADGALDADLLPVLWQGYLENLRFFFSWRPGGESATYQQLLALALTLVAVPSLVIWGSRRRPKPANRGGG